MAGGSAAACRAQDAVAEAECDQTYPALTGRVVDEAALLTPEQESAMTTELAAFEAKTLHQFAVVTVRSLQNRSVEDFSLCLAKHWGIGRKAHNDGLMLLVAPVERKARIEVGYGLENAVTDAEAQTIMDQTIIPQFREGHMAQGIEAGVSAIIKEAS